jgi:hypothetical protein
VVINADQDHVLFVHGRLLYRMADSLVSRTHRAIYGVPEQQPTAL